MMSRPAKRSRFDIKCPETYLTSLKLFSRLKLPAVFQPSSGREKLFRRLTS
jgi:hypothetical protein